MMRGKLQVGDLIFQKGSDLGAKLIRFWTHSDYTHVIMYIGKGFIVHSTLKTGVVIMYYDTWKEYYSKADVVDVFRPISELKEYIPDVVNWAITKAGKPYDWKAIAKFVFDRLHIHILKERSDAYFCSEFIMEAWKSKNISLVDKPSYEVSPGDLSDSKCLVKIGNQVGTELLKSYAV